MTENMKRFKAIGGVVVTFKTADEIARDEHDWGTFAAVSSPADGAERIMTVEATFLPGKSHAFHRHPNQEEVIYVLEGELEQWVEDERRLLRAGDAVIVSRGRRARVVQRRRRAGADHRRALPVRGRRRLRGRGARRRGAVAVAARRRVMQAFRIHEGGEGRFEEAPDPVAGPGEVRRRAPGGGAEPARHPRPQPARARVRLPQAVRGRARRRGRSARHGRGGRDLSGRRLGPERRPSRCADAGSAGRSTAPSPS